MRLKLSGWIKWASIAILGVLLILGTMGWLVYMPPNGTSINSVPVGSAANKVAITFDDGPNPPYTDEILAILDEHSVEATFFMTGFLEVVICSYVKSNRLAEVFLQFVYRRYTPHRPQFGSRRLGIKKHTAQTLINNHRKTGCTRFIREV